MNQILTKSFDFEIILKNAENVNVINIYLPHFARYLQR